MRTAIALLAALLLSSPCLAAEPLKETRFTLENGLKVEIVEQHRVPAVAHFLWVDTGSADDPRGKSGLSHYLEHMLFKGSTFIDEEHYNAAIEALGGEHNAFTNQDVTAYYVVAARAHLPEVMRLEADRFLHWKPKDDVYTSERDVILEERRLRTENQPSALLSEAMTATLYRNHPYRIPIIGWMHEMETLSPDDAKHWFDTYYQPKNATLLLVGDVTPEAGRKLAEEHFGEWKNTAALPKREWSKEPPRRVAEAVTMRHASVQQPLWRRYYNAPSLVEGKTEQAVPLMLLTEMLGADRTGFLYKRLVKEQKKAAAVNIGYSGFSRGPEILVVSLAPAPGVTMDDLGRAYEAALKAALADGGLTAAELKRAKNGMKAEMIFARDGLDGIAFFLAQLRMLGLPASYFTELPAKVDAVTLRQALEAGRDVFDDAHAVTGLLLPEGRDVATQAVETIPTGGADGGVH